MALDVKGRDHQSDIINPLKTINVNVTVALGRVHYLGIMTVCIK